MASKSAFVQVSAPEMGLTLVVNRFDYDPADRISGVGNDILNTGQNETEVGLIVMRLAKDCLKHRGHGVTIIDGGANIGHLSTFWARQMHGASMNPWGKVISIEAQTWPYRCLVSNVTINNCYNVEPHNFALAAPGTEFVSVPIVHPLQPHNYGSTHLGNGEGKVAAITIDTLMVGRDRLDILKLDIEGMEPQALDGAQGTLKRFKPLIVAEHLICGVQAIKDRLPAGYDMVTGDGMNSLCVHEDSKLTGLQAAISEWKANTRAA